PPLAGRETRRRTSASTSSPAGPRLPRPAASPSSAGSICCLHPLPHSVPLLPPLAKFGSTSEPIGPRSTQPSTPSAENAGSNPNSLSGPRHKQLDTRPANDDVSPPAPGAPNAPAGTHTNNPGNLPQRSAPGSTGSPLVLPGRVPLVCPTASVSHSL